MSIASSALNAYTQAARLGSDQGSAAAKPGPAQEEQQSFAGTLQDSLEKVNEMQTDKSRMIEEFAAGKSNDVQGLMVSIQKAGIAMKMTTAVRGKVLEAYKEVMKMPL
jgi:flagellar hook-basal body complex protein FliE